MPSWRRWLPLIEAGRATRMIEQQGRVIRTEKGLAWVRVGRTGGCPACEAGDGCGAGVFAKLLNRGSLEICVANPGGVRAGTAVMLGIDESLFLDFVIRLYGWPLGAGLLGAVLGHWFAARFYPVPLATDLAALLAGIAAFVVCFRRLAAALQDRMKPITGRDGLYAEICLTEVKCENR